MKEIAACLTQLAARWTGFRADAIPRDALERAIDAEVKRGASVTDLLSRAFEGEAELIARLVESVAVPETYFFRQPEHFAWIASTFVPSRAGAKSIRAWSTGCATGEEAYSLAAVLLASAPPGVRVEVLGTDLVPSRLARAMRGRYPSRSLRHGEHAAWPAFDRSGDELVIRPEVRAATSFFPHNLLDPLPPGAGAFDLVLCRNVLVYFSPDASSAAAKNLASALGPDGALLVGPMDLGDAPPPLARGEPPELMLFQTTRAGTRRARRPALPRELPSPARAATPAYGTRVRGDTGKWLRRVEAKRPVLDPVRRHVAALAAIERGELRAAEDLLAGIEREARDYVPGLVERALLLSRAGRAGAAADIMRQVLSRTEGRDETAVVDAPEPLPLRFYRDAARAFLEQQGGAA